MPRAMWDIRCTIDTRVLHRPHRRQFVFSDLEPAPALCSSSRREKSIYHDRPGIRPRFVLLTTQAMTASGW